MVGGLEVSPIVPPSRTFCPASPSLQWVPWASVPHLPGRQALAHRPSVRCSATTATTPSRPPPVVPCSPIPWCDPLLHSQPGPRTTPPRWARRFSIPAPRSGTFPRSVVALPSSRVTPLNACPALRPRWCPQHSPSRVQDCCLPPLAKRRLSPLVRTEAILLTTTIHISGLNHAACVLATPGSIPPIAGTHAGSLPTGWLGVSRVGFAPCIPGSHPLGHINEFHELSPIPSFRASLARAGVC